MLRTCTRNTTQKMKGSANTSHVDKLYGDKYERSHLLDTRHGSTTAVLKSIFISLRGVGWTVLYTGAEPGTTMLLLLTGRNRPVYSCYLPYTAACGYTVHTLWRRHIHAMFYLFFATVFCNFNSPAKVARSLTLIDLLDKPWTQVSFLGTPRHLPSLLARA